MQSPLWALGWENPQHFSLSPSETITAELNKKYANRVLHDVGLCVCVFDLAEVGEGRVRYGDGFLWYAGESQSYSLRVMWGRGKEGKGEEGKRDKMLMKRDTQ